LEEKLMSEIAVGKEGDLNQAGTHLTPGTKKQIANFNGKLNTAGSALTRIDEDGSTAVFTFDAAFHAYIFHNADGSVETFTANRYGEWVWSGDRRDARRAFEIYNPVAESGALRAPAAAVHSAEPHRNDDPCRLAAVIASNGEATKYHYCANGRLVGVITVGATPGPLGFY
jgi:YD repeat-containing protein